MTIIDLVFTNRHNLKFQTIKDVIVSDHCSIQLDMGVRESIKSKQLIIPGSIDYYAFRRMLSKKGDELPRTCSEYNVFGEIV